MPPSASTNNVSSPTPASAAYADRLNSRPVNILLCNVHGITQLLDWTTSSSIALFISSMIIPLPSVLTMDELSKQHDSSE